MADLCCVCLGGFELNDYCLELRLNGFDPGPKSGRPVLSPDRWPDGSEVKYLHLNGECEELVDELLGALGLYGEGYNEPTDVPEEAKEPDLLAEAEG